MHWNKLLMSVIAINAIFFNSQNKSDSNQMNNTDCEIIEAIKSSKALQFFLNQNFENLKNNEPNPIFPYKVNYKDKKANSITFCGFPTLDCWALKLDDSYTFYVVLKEDSTIARAITKNFGQSYAQGDAHINDNHEVSSFIYWENKDQNIWLKKMLNFRKVTKYDSCYLVIIGNLEYSNIISIPADDQ